MLKAKLIIILILFGTIGNANGSAIRYFNEHHKPQNTISQKKSKESNQVTFSFEDVFIEEEDEDENNHKKYFSYRLTSNLEFSFSITNILLANVKLCNKYFFIKHFSDNPLYIRFANFRI